MKVLMCWSGGKDSALALYEILRQNLYECVGLLTTITADYARVSMHGVRRELLRAQAEQIGMPLFEVTITKQSSNEEYEARMQQALERFRRSGVGSVVFGDIFLEDVRKYREENLARVGMTGIFPLWGKDSRALMEIFISLGFKAVVTCVDTQLLDGGFAGRYIDESFLESLPEGVDPSGENGEFHSFVFDGPMFTRPVSFRKGRTVLRDGRFRFCDLVPLPDRS